jgi:hypothetical protein
LPAKNARREQTESNAVLNRFLAVSEANVANYLNDYLIGKVSKLRQEMPTTNSEPSYSYIKINIERKAM